MQGSSAPSSSAARGNGWADVVRILAISGSLRARSSNTELLRAAARLAPADVRVTIYEALAGLPHFNPDLDDEGAVRPTEVRELDAALASADALLISSPEYAHGVPGSLKNALDWLVSGPSMPGMPVGLLNASSRSSHAHASLEETLRTMSATVVKQATRVVPLDGRGLDADSIAADPSLAAMIRDAMRALTEAVAIRKAQVAAGR
jgi:NAD(P)H-dependent FMN reductase